MPSQYVRPKPSQEPPLSEAAKRAYEARGWKITPNGGVDTGQTEGPCARCRERTTVYGPRGRPLCASCEKKQDERAERLRREQRERNANG